ncbi:SRPBCC family protein [Pseudonocardia sp. GCM10023141]|uniref:SRPBCC family protein n=1 Tax=Pseudonocardia sp. GCM10023141 TaxID=3252653 RepID=UPI00360B6010
MTGRAELELTVDIGAPAELVWHTVTDWPAQGEWMLGTRVEVVGAGDGRRAGARLRAVTGVGPLAFTDPMEIVEWAPPHRCVVRHHGNVVRGGGTFEVRELGPQRARFVWGEQLDLPLGALGRLGWPVVRPAFRAGVQQSLRKLAQVCEQRFRDGDHRHG